MTHWLDWSFAPLSRSLPELWAIIVGSRDLPAEVVSWTLIGVVVVGRLLLALVIVALGHIAIRLLRRLLDRVIRVEDEAEAGYLPTSRAQTLRSLLDSILAYGVNFIVLLTILDTVLGIDTTAVLAGAGILGLAVGFGAQNLVRDVISGFFILYENQISVGDHVVISNVEGVVDSLGLRVTTVRDFDGALHYLANGDIQMVQNYSRGDVRLTLDVPVAYEEDVSAAISSIQAVCDQVAAARDDITRGPDVLGISEFGASEVVLRLAVWTTPMQQWDAGRELRGAIKQALEQADIEIPYARQVLVPPEQTKLAQAFRFAAAGAEAESEQSESKGDEGRSEEP